jgi:DNA-binding transcriptional regulator GbsR (MarR family)
MLQRSDWQVLNYLTLAKEPAFVSQIARETGLGKSSVSRALRTLKKYSFIKNVQRGKSIFFEVDKRYSAVPKIRIALNLIEIEPKLTALKKSVNKIVLYGSCSKGIDTSESDVDLLVITSDKMKAIHITQNIKFNRRAQWVIKTPQEYVILNNKEPVFAEELAAGITLWEADETTRI